MVQPSFRNNYNSIVNGSILKDSKNNPSNYMSNRILDSISPNQAGQSSLDLNYENENQVQQFNLDDKNILNEI